MPITITVIPLLEGCKAHRPAADTIRRQLRANGVDDSLLRITSGRARTWIAPKWSALTEDLDATALIDEATRVLRPLWSDSANRLHPLPGALVIDRAGYYSTTPADA